MTVVTALWSSRLLASDANNAGLTAPRPREPTTRRSPSRTRSSIPTTVELSVKAPVTSCRRSPARARRPVRGRRTRRSRRCRGPALRKRRARRTIGPRVGDDEFDAVQVCFGGGPAQGPRRVIRVIRVIDDDHAQVAVRTQRGGRRPRDPSPHQRTAEVWCRAGKRGRSCCCWLRQVDLGP